MAKRTDVEKMAAIAQAYQSGNRTAKEVAEQFGVSKSTACRAIQQYSGAPDAVIDRRHAEVMEQRRQEHADATTWMEHVTPIHRHKQRLEAEIRARQEALDKARDEYRNFLATLKQLMEDTT